MSDLTPRTPMHTAWFAVGVPTTQYRDRAREIVQRYLYEGEVTNVALSDDERLWIVTVRVEAYGDTSIQQLSNRLQMQADRFSSGLYPVGEAIIR